MARIACCIVVVLTLTRSTVVGADAPAEPVTITPPEGTIKVTLTATVKGESVPLPVSHTIPETADKIQLHAELRLENSVNLKIRWVAINVEGVSAGRKIAESGSYRTKREQASDVWLQAPHGGFHLGEYRVEVEAGRAPVTAISFQVVPASASADVVRAGQLPSGYNIALAALGGKIESATSEFDHKTWAANNLIDGYTFVTGGRGASNAGWQSKDRTFPQDIVLSFHEGREATVGAVVIDTATFDIATYDKVNFSPKQVEIWASTRKRRRRVHENRRKPACAIGYSANGLLSTGPGQIPQGSVRLELRRFAHPGRGAQSHRKGGAGPIDRRGHS